MLKIWGRLSSINVQKVVICAKVLGIAFERVDAGAKFGIVDTPDYQRMNPNALVPTIEDGDFVLWESNAIVRYLSHAYGRGRLWPDDPRRLADADRWMDWQTTTLTPAMGDAFWQLIRTPVEQREAAKIQASIEKTEQRIAILERHLSSRRFVAGDALTMGDIPVACAAHRWIGLPCEKVARPHVERWVTGLRAQPAFGEVLTLPIV